MRRQKKFLVLFIILIGISVLKFYTVARTFERVDQFRGANIRHEIFSLILLKVQIIKACLFRSVEKLIQIYEMVCFLATV